MVALSDLGSSLDLPWLSRDRLRGFIKTGIAKILRHQQADGGFPMWMGADPEVHLTAYALHGLRLAKQAGYDAPAEPVARAVAWLRREVNSDTASWAGHAFAGESAARAFALAELAAHGQPDAGAMSRIYDQSAGLPIYGKAWLAQALWRSGDAARAATLLGEIAAAAPAGDGPVKLSEPEEASLGWYFSSEPRTTGAALAAFVETQPDSPLIARLVAGLIDLRQGGHWETTQADAWAMEGLAAFARAKKSSSVKVTVGYGGDTLLAATLAKNAVGRARRPIAGLDGDPIRIEAGGEVFYSVRLRVARSLGAEAAADGLAVAREYLDATTGAALAKARRGDLVRVRLRVSAPENLSYVAVVDRLPGGLEALNRRLETVARDDRTDGERRPWWESGYRTNWNHEEVRDDRVAVFANRFVAGDAVYEYLARATIAGTFAAPAATAEAMYRPRIHGRSPSATFEVIE